MCDDCDWSCHSLFIIGHCVSVTQFIHRKAYSCVSSLSPRDNPVAWLGVTIVLATWEAEARGLFALLHLSHPGQHSETASQKQRDKLKF